MRTTTGTRWRHWSAVVLALALVAAACGGDDDDTAGGPADDVVEEEGDPKPGGTLIMAFASDINTLHPYEQASTNTHNRVGLVYNRLITFDTGPDVEYSEHILVPDLAEDWEVADDGLTYTFHLRDDVTWQNVPPVNGRPFVADDVVATLTAIRDGGFQSYMLENVTGIEAADDHTVVLTLSEPFAPLLNYMANHHMWILPREAIEGQIDLTQTAIGTGPFIMTGRQQNVETTYVRNPDYFEEGLPYLDGIRILVMPDQSSKIAAFRSGEIDLSTTGLSPEEVELLRRTNPDVNYETELSSTLFQLYVNPQREPFGDVRVRRAINHAINRMALGEALYEAAIYTGPVAPALGEWVLPQDELEEHQAFDPERSRQLLAEAGFPDGFDTSIMMTTGYGEQVVRMGEWIVQDLAEVGIRVDLELLDYSTYIGARWPAVDYFIGIGPQTPFLEPDEWLRAQFQTGAGRNWYNISDPQLDAMLDEQARILDEEERREAVLDIQRYMLEDIVNPIQLFSPEGVTPEQPWVKGWHPHASYGYPQMKTVWLDR